MVILYDFILCIVNCHHTTIWGIFLTVSTFFEASYDAIFPCNLVYVDKNKVPGKQVAGKSSINFTPETSHPVCLKNYGCFPMFSRYTFIPKNHGISKLVVWRSQTPPIHIQTPLLQGPVILRDEKFTAMEPFRLFEAFNCPSVDHWNRWPCRLGPSSSPRRASLPNGDELEEDESNDKLPKQLDVAKVVVVGRGNSVDLQFICCFSWNVAGFFCMELI